MGRTGREMAQEAREGAQGAPTPYATVEAVRARYRAGYTLPADLGQLRTDLDALLDLAEAAVDILAQVEGWCDECASGEIGADFAVTEIAPLVKGWGEM